MGTRKVEREIEVCDVCEMEKSTYKDCLVCGAEMCLICNTTITGCIVTLDICKNCCELDEVKEIVKEYAPKLNNIRNKRDEEISKIQPEGSDDSDE